MIHLHEGFSNTRVCIFSVNMYGTKGFSQNLKHIPTTVVECLKKDLGTRHLDSDYNVTHSKLHNQLRQYNNFWIFKKYNSNVTLHEKSVCEHMYPSAHTYSFVCVLQVLCVCIFMYVCVSTFALKEPRIICGSAVGKSLSISTQI